MAFTLSNLLIEGLTRLGKLTVGTATGGSNTTLVDTTLAKRDDLGDEDFLDNTLFIIRDAAGASAAPEGEFGRITAFVASTQTFTVDAFSGTTTPASGDTYGISDSTYPRDQLIRLANTALVELGDVPLIDTTTLDTAASQTEYTAAVAWKRQRPYRVDIQGRTGDANDNQWETVWDWDWVPATAGSTGLIVFSEQPPVLRDIRVWYKGVHPTLTAYNSTIYEGLDPDLVTKAFILKCLEWKLGQDGGSDAFLLQQYNKAITDFQQEKLDNPAFHVKSRPRLLILGRDDGDHLPYPYPYGPA